MSTRRGALMLLAATFLLLGVVLIIVPASTGADDCGNALQHAKDAPECDLARDDRKLQIGGALALGSLALVASFVTSSQRTDSGRVDTSGPRDTSP